MPSQQAAELEAVIADAVATAGFDLDSVQVQQAGKRRVVKVVVDAESIDLDRVADASRAVSTALDEHDALLGGAPYTLEVTSPGVDRPLRLPRHWRRARLRLVKVRTNDDTEFTGRVGDADEDPAGGVVILVDGAMNKVAYADVASAKVEVEFKAPPERELAMLGMTEKEESR